MLELGPLCVCTKRTDGQLKRFVCKVVAIRVSDLFGFFEAEVSPVSSYVLFDIVVSRWLKRFDDAAETRIDAVP